MGSGASLGKHPDHWTKIPSKEYRTDGFKLLPLSQQTDSALWKQLATFLEVDDPKNLGVGRDIKEKTGKYVALRLACCWRIQHPDMWARFEAGKAKIRRDVRSIASAGKGKGRLPPGLPTRLHGRARSLPGPALDDEVNETMLMHGTKPQFLLDILANGPNERYSGAGLFGNGMYFGEDADKVDQYVSVEKEFIELKGGKGALHARLYGNKREQKHPGDVLYLLICRVALGHFVRTREKAPSCKSLDGGGGYVFAKGGENTRELANVEKVSPPVHYHALLGEKGPGHVRHREIVLFHGEYVYPEYLLGVQRINEKGKTVG